MSQKTSSDTAPTLPSYAPHWKVKSIGELCWWFAVCTSNAQKETQRMVHAFCQIWYFPYDTRCKRLWDKPNVIRAFSLIESQYFYNLPRLFRGDGKHDRAVEIHIVEARARARAGERLNDFNCNCVQWSIMPPVIKHFECYVLIDCHFWLLEPRYNGRGASWK